MTERRRHSGRVVLAGALLAGALATAGLAPAAVRWVLPAPSLSSLPLGPVLEGATRRGALVVGVRSYARPAPPGTPTPPEPDRYDAALARHLAERLGLPLHLVHLDPAAQDAALRDRRVDLVVAGARDRPADDGLATSEGDYDGAPGMLLALRAGPLRGTGDLAGQPVCVVQGSGWLRTLAQRHGARPVAYPSSVHAASAFMAGECQALADHEDVLRRLLQSEEWRFYRPIVDGLRPDAQAAIRLAGGDPRSRAWLGAALRDWQASGAQERARSARVGNVQFEVGLLKDGLVCHA